MPPQGAGSAAFFKDEVRKSQGGDTIRRMRGTESSRHAAIGRAGQVLQSKRQQRTRDDRRRVMFMTHGASSRMKSGIAPIARWLACASAMLLAACATHAPDFGGRWRDANAYADAPQEIPLQQAYVYTPSPMDGTLRNMLQRWTHDAGLRLQYEHRSDFTLHVAVARIRTPDLQQAVALLNDAYAAQQVSVALAGGSLTVRPVDDAAAATKP
jgi:hypothetical protein